MDISRQKSAVFERHKTPPVSRRATVHRAVTRRHSATGQPLTTSHHDVEHAATKMTRTMSQPLLVRTQPQHSEEANTTCVLLTTPVCLKCCRYCVVKKSATRRIRIEIHRKTTTESSENSDDGEVREVSDSSLLQSGLHPDYISRLVAAALARDKTRQQLMRRTCTATTSMSRTSNTYNSTASYATFTEMTEDTTTNSNGWLCCSGRGPSPLAKMLGMPPPATVVCRFCLLLMPFLFFIGSLLSLSLAWNNIEADFHVMAVFVAGVAFVITGIITFLYNCINYHRLYYGLSTNADYININHGPCINLHAATTLARER